jgi:RHS repeat-associated protein
VGTLFEKNVTTGVTTTYYYAGSTRVAMRVISSTGNVLYYLHADHLGSASLTTDANGNVTSQLRYLPYGAPRPNYPTGSVPTDYRFTGQRSDAYINLYEMGARWYDADLGRWLSPDSIVPQPENPQTLNRFAYVNNNPVRYTDPSGHCIWDLCIVEGIGLVELAALGGAAFLTAYYYGPGSAERRAALVTNIGSLLPDSVKYESKTGSSASVNNALSHAAGQMGSLDPRDPKHKRMVDDIYKEHNQGNSSVSQKTLDKMLEDIRARTGAGEVDYTGFKGHGADFPKLNTDITSFQSNDSTYSKFSQNLYSALKEKAGQDYVQNVYMQMNTGLQYDVQTALNESMSAWSKEGLRMLNSIFLYDTEGSLVASWVAGAIP